MTHKKNGVWTSDKVEIVRRGRIMGLSYRQISEDLILRFGPEYTKNACVSLGQRNDFETPPKPVSAKPAPKPVRSLRPTPPVRAEPKKDIKEPTPIGVHDDFGPKGTCKYIHGFPSDGSWQMCGHPHKNDRPYCDYHQSRVYDSVSTKRSNRGDRPKTWRPIQSVRFNSV